MNLKICFIVIVSVCLNGTVLNGRTEHVINLGKQLDNCISKHKDYNLTICTECKDNYKNLINYYNEQKIKEEFCMDVVDLVSLLCNVFIFNS